MRTFAQLMSRIELRVLLFVLGLVAFVKPIVLPMPKQDTASTMLSFFIPWALLVAVLFLMSRFEVDDPDDEPTAADAKKD